MYPAAVPDWHSRYVVSRRVSNTLDGGFCLAAPEDAFRHGCPEIFNTDQGTQFTAERFTAAVENAGVRMSMDGRGRALDNIFIQRLWRSVKYEEVYIKDYRTARDAYESLKAYFLFYNNKRLHQTLGYLTPAEVHYQ